MNADKNFDLAGVFQPQMAKRDAKLKVSKTNAAVFICVYLCLSVVKVILR